MTTAAVPAALATGGGGGGGGGGSYTAGPGVTGSSSVSLASYQSANGVLVITPVFAAT